jgi:shikimate kinase
MAPENQQALSKGFVIYLEADPRLLWTRLKTDQSRPLLTQADDPRAKIEELHALRDPIYRGLADHVVSSTKGSLAQVLGQIEARLVAEGLAAPSEKDAT